MFYYAIQRYANIIRVLCLLHHFGDSTYYKIIAKVSQVPSFSGGPVTLL